MCPTSFLYGVGKIEEGGRKKKKKKSTKPKTPAENSANVIGLLALCVSEYVDH